MTILKVYNEPSTTLNVTNEVTRLVKVIQEGVQGRPGINGGNVYVTEDEPTGDIPEGSLWFNPLAQLMSVYHNAEWVTQLVDIHQTHEQLVPSAVWNISHGLNKHPSVSITDSSGDQVLGDVTYHNDESLTVSFSAPFSGYAHLN